MTIQINDRRGTKCGSCGEFCECNRLSAAVTSEQRIDCKVEEYLCDFCLSRVTTAIYDPIIGHFLKSVLSDALRAERGVVLAQEKIEQQKRAAQWQEGAEFLCRVLNRHGCLGTERIALIKAIRCFTPLGLKESKDLVEVAMEAARKPLEIPSTLGLAAMLNGSAQ